MNNHFLIENHIVGDPSVSAFVLATDALGPLNYIQEVEEELSNCKASGLVVFDLLISHGNKNNRFLTAFFDGTKFLSYDFKADNFSYDSFSKLAAPILKAHNPEISGRFLSKAMKFAIKNGIPF